MTLWEPKNLFSQSYSQMTKKKKKKKTHIGPKKKKTPKIIEMQFLNIFLNVMY